MEPFAPAEAVITGGLLKISSILTSAPTRISLVPIAEPLHLKGYQSLDVLPGFTAGKSIHSLVPDNIILLAIKTSSLLAKGKVVLYLSGVMVYM